MTFRFALAVLAALCACSRDPSERRAPAGSAASADAVPRYVEDVLSAARTVADQARTRCDEVFRRYAERGECFQAFQGIGMDYDARPTKPIDFGTNALDRADVGATPDDFPYVVHVTVPIRDSDFVQVEAIVQPD